MNHVSEEERYLPIITRKASVKLRVSEIEYVMRDNRRLELFTEGEQKHYCFYEKISAVEAFLDHRFYACMEGCILNLEKIVRMENCAVFFADGKVLHLGRDSFIRARQRFNRYLREMKTAAAPQVEKSSWDAECCPPASSIENACIRTFDQI